MKKLIQSISTNVIDSNIFYIDNTLDFKTINQQLSLVDTDKNNILMIYCDNSNDNYINFIKSINCNCRKIFLISKKDALYISRSFFYIEKALNLTPSKVNIFNNTSISTIIQNILILLLNSTININEIFLVVYNSNTISVFKLQNS